MALSLASILCNDSDITNEGIEIGDPTEVALINYADKNDIDYKEIREKYKRVGELPFDSDRKLMSTINMIEGKHVMFTKGAPDVMFSRCKYALKHGEVVEINDEIINDIRVQMKSFQIKHLEF